MAAQIRVVIKFNKFPACPGAMARAVGEAFNTVGPTLLGEMQNRTPVDTGELRNSESSTVGDKQLTLSASAGHAGFVEFGTRKMAAQPYMRPTIESGASQIGAAVAASASAAFGSL